MDDIQHTDTRKLVCPYCGLDHDSKDYELGEDGEFLCICGKHFHYEVYVEYTTRSDCELNDG